MLSLPEAALEVAARLGDLARLTRQQAELVRRRAELERIISKISEDEAVATAEPHSKPRHKDAEIARDVAVILDGEAKTLEAEADRAETEANAARQRADSIGFRQ